MPEYPSLEKLQTYELQLSLACCLKARSPVDEHKFIDDVCSALHDIAKGGIAESLLTVNRKKITIEIAENLARLFLCTMGASELEPNELWSDIFMENAVDIFHNVIIMGMHVEGNLVRMGIRLR